MFEYSKDPDPPLFREHRGAPIPLDTD
jgi:hypothetical protein